MSGFAELKRVLRPAAELAEQLATVLRDGGAPSNLELGGVATLIVDTTSISTPIARLALEAARARVEPSMAPPRPATFSRASEANLVQHGPAPSACWNCGWTSWWKASSRSARWLCARCSPPDPSHAGLWYEASAADLEDAAREPRWSESPEQDDYVLLRLRQVAQDAARSAGDLLGAWRPAAARTTADLRALDFHSITDAAAILAAAEELHAWALEHDPAAHDVALRALAGLLGWPAAALSPVFDHALSLLSAGPSSAAITALGQRWPQGHEPGSADPIPLRIDENTEVLVPAHPHLVLLLLGVRPRKRERATASAKAVAHRTASAPSAELTSAARLDLKPPTSCSSCRGQRFFRFDQPWSAWTCAACHPPVLPAERFVWHTCDATAP